MEFLTNSERILKNAKSSRGIGMSSGIRRISPYETTFAGKGNMSRRAAVLAFRTAAKRQLRDRSNTNN